MRKSFIILLFTTFIVGSVPDKRVVAEWEPAIGTMVRWPLGIPSDLVVELARNDVLYVLVENSFQQSQAQSSFTSWGIDMQNVTFIFTQTYSHWTRDHGPQFLIGQDHWEVVNQRFDGYPEEGGCNDEPQDCDENMILVDCDGTEFCNNQPDYIEEGYDCYINNELCQDFNGDGVIMDWLGDGYCDDGSWGLDFMCDDYSWDCGDCGEGGQDNNGFCDQAYSSSNRINKQGRPVSADLRGWEEDDDTNIDFANQLGWDIKDLPLFLTGGNFMTDGYGMGFSTELMVNENNMSQDQFLLDVSEHLSLDTYHILDNPNVSSIQHIDCMAKLTGPETVIIKQVPESSPEYDCIENFASAFNSMSTFYGRPFKVHRLFCPSINGGSWETNPVAAYTNSLILNNKVLVPQYGILADQQALETYRNAMPGYDIIGFDGATGSPWYGEDALHCRTMGVFDPEMIHLSHKSIRSEEIESNSNILVEVEVLDYSGENIETVSMFWKYSAEDGPFQVIDLELEGGAYRCMFPTLNPSSGIEYYLTATNALDASASHPNAGWHLFTTTSSVAGDINGDTEINIQDVVLLINIILGSLENESGDINGDGFVDILDVVKLVNTILEL